MTAVERIDPGVRFDEALPVVIAGGARALRATQMWDASYLAAAIGGVRIKYKLSSCHQHPDFHAGTIGEWFKLGSSTFAEFLDAITTGPRDERARRLLTGDEQFLLQRRDGVTTENAELRPLLDDVGMPDVVPADRLYTVWPWFSGPGVRTWIHYDNNGCHNLNLQLTGGKSCRLYSPEHLLAPYEPGGGNPAVNCSSIDVEETGALAGVPYLEATLEAGDMLFIPAWWWHTFVHHGELNSNVNFWWKPIGELDNSVSRRERTLTGPAKTPR